MRILLAHHGSSGSWDAVSVLNALPLPATAHVTVLTVASPGREARAAEIAARCAEHLRLPGTVETRTRTGYPEEEILDLAAATSTDLILVGATSRGALPQFLLGSVAERVVHHASCSVLVARPLKDEIRKVLLGFDGTDPACAAAKALQKFPLQPTTVFEVVTVYPPLPGDVRIREPVYVTAAVEETMLTERREQAVAALTDAGKHVTVAALEGDPALRLLELARDADLAVVGSHGAGLGARFVRFLLGSVAEKLIRHAPCSVLVARAGASPPA